MRKSVLVILLFIFALILSSIPATAQTGGQLPDLFSLLQLLATPSPSGTPGAAVPAATATTGDIDWPLYGRDLNNTRYVDTDLINSGNVANLKPLWIFHTGLYDPDASFEATPIVVNGTMYVSTGHNDVYALDAATGAEKWAYHGTDHMPSLDKLNVCCGQDNRGVVYGDGKVYIGRLDAVLVALDANTGEMAWQTLVDDWQNSYSITMAPQFVDGLVLIGVAGGEYKIRGHLDAYDASTGDLVWRFFTTFPGDTWEGDSWMTGGGPVWTTPPVDTSLGLVYLTTGNASPDLNGSQRAGQNLYTSSIVALDVKSGQVKWYFQEVHHGLWDYDATQPPVLFNVEKDGQMIPAIGHANKNSEYFILDRRDGTPVYPVSEQPVDTDPAWQNPWPTQPRSSVERLVPDTVQEGPLDPNLATVPMFTVPEPKPQVIQPGADGGAEWPPAALSPRTNYIYMEAQYLPHWYQAFPSFLEGFGSTASPRIPGIVDYAVIGALDTTTGKLAWTRRYTSGAYSGIVAAGDLIFYGESSGNLHAADAKSGDVLWTFRSDNPYVGGCNGGTMSYVLNGTQYVAVPFGGSVNQNKDAWFSPLGDALVVFGLPPAGYSGPKEILAKNVAQPTPQPGTTATPMPTPTTAPSLTPPPSSTPAKPGPSTTPITNATATPLPLASVTGNATPAASVTASASPTAGATGTATPATGVTGTATPATGTTRTATSPAGAVTTATPPAGAVATATSPVGAVATATSPAGAVATATSPAGAAATLSP